MGVWGIGIIDNEIACQLAIVLENYKDLALIEEIFDGILASDHGSLDESDCVAGLAAAEVIARLLGNFGQRNACTSRVDSWLLTRNIGASPMSVSMAVRVVDRILSERSALMESWKVTGLFEAWKSDVEDLRSRILAGGAALRSVS